MYFRINLDDLKIFRAMELEIKFLVKFSKIDLSLFTKSSCSRNMISREY